MNVTYDPSVFAVATQDQAKRIILTGEDSTTERRWATETPYLCGLITSSIELGPESRVLDYGCGIGRMAKALIERRGCRVEGLDTSESMRRLSMRYVASQKFSASEAIVGSNAFDAAIAIWVLQHCPRLATDIASIKGLLKPGGALFVVNMLHRSVPTVERGWVSDNLDVFGMLDDAFGPAVVHPLDPAGTTPAVAKVSGWAVYRRRPPET